MYLFNVLIFRVMIDLLNILMPVGKLKLKLWYS